MLGRPLRHIRNHFVAYLALFVALGGTSYAATSHGATGSVIQACYTKSGGWLHLGTSASCKKNELPVAWSLDGPAGPQGPQGPKGDTGSQGPAGPPGASPLAYAHVTNGVLDTTRLGNVIAMTRKMGTFNPVYCFDLTTSPRSVIVSPEMGRDQGFSLAAGTVAGTSGMSQTPCDPGTDAAVVAEGDASFYVVFN